MALHFSFSCCFLFDHEYTSYENRKSKFIHCYFLSNSEKACFVCLKKKQLVAWQLLPPATNSTTRVRARDRRKGRIHLTIVLYVGMKEGRLVKLASLQQCSRLCCPFFSLSGQGCDCVKQTKPYPNTGAVLCTRQAIPTSLSLP